MHATEKHPRGIYSTRKVHKQGKVLSNETFYPKRYHFSLFFCGQTIANKKSANGEPNANDILKCETKSPRSCCQFVKKSGAETQPYIREN